MSDGDALLRSVLGASSAGATRLVYADWLDENGEGERAEFVRVQCKLECLKKPNSFGIPMVECECGHQGFAAGIWKQADCRPCRFRVRERELFSALPVGSFPAFNNGSQQVRLESQRSAGHMAEMIVRRGFVAHVELLTAAFLAHAAGLFAAQPVVSVRLTDRVPAEHVSSIDTRTYPHRRPFWFVGSQTGINERERHWIPPEIGRLIVGDTKPGGRDAVYFDSADAANAALSAACVHYARNLCGLPPLPLPGPGGRPANPAGG
jgi:uncharacterized protein (TIGR02996 family)